jgi:hypothetical protein
MPEMGAEQLEHFVKSVCNFCLIVAVTATKWLLFVALPNIKFCDKNWVVLGDDSCREIHGHFMFYKYCFWVKILYKIM